MKFQSSSHNTKLKNHSNVIYPDDKAFVHTVYIIIDHFSEKEYEISQYANLSNY